MSTSNLSHLEELLTSNNDIIQFDNFISDEELKDIKSKLLDSFDSNHFNLTMSDGVFFPFPYSSVHKNINQSENYYFEYSEDFNKKHQHSIQIIIERLQKKLQSKIEPLIYKDGDSMSHLNTRILFSKKNGIDIHCENAFIHQLNDEFANWLKSKVDLENAISFFLILQKSEKGGDLVIYNQTWNKISFKLDATTYEERHDIDGSIFKNRDIDHVSYKKITPKTGDAVVFRAAQIWHSIDKIEGISDRISIGCFIAKGHDGKNYFWA